MPNRAIVSLHQQIEFPSREFREGSQVPDSSIAIMRPPANFASGRPRKGQVENPRIAEDAYELVQLRRQIAEMDRQLDVVNTALVRERALHALEVRRFRQGLIEAERKLQRLRTTIIFQLGQAVLEGTKSFSGMIALPGKLLDIRRQAVERRCIAQREDVAVPSTAEGVPEQVTACLELYPFGGVMSVQSYVESIRDIKPAQRAVLYTEIAKKLLAVNTDDGIFVARLATQIDPRAYRMKWLAFKLWDAGHITEARIWIRRAREDQALSFKASEKGRADEIEDAYSLLVNGFDIGPKVSLRAPHHRRRVGYVVSSAEPFNTSGYTSRTESLVSALNQNGYRAEIFLRPGYPYDRVDAATKVQSEQYEHRGNSHHVTTGEGLRDLRFLDQLEIAAGTLEATFRHFEPSIIHAASDYRNALPALIAARRLGIPFVYEVRGFWELTTASKRPGWEESERFDISRRMETLCAANADRVATLTPYMAKELVARGVAADRISLVPNCVDSSAFSVLPLNLDGRTKLGIPQDAFVVGYAGSLVEYEGLDDLIKALAQLLPTMPKLHLLIVGDGLVRPALERLARRLQIERRVTMTGRVQAEEVAGYIAMMDAYAVPRRPDLVCQLVSPLKPLEGMAMGKPVIVSDVGGMHGMVEDGVTGFVHRSADIASLASKIRDCATDRDLSERCAAAGRVFVETQRTWANVARSMGQVYDSLEAMAER